MPLIALLLGIRLPSGRRRVELLFSAVLMLVDWLVGCSEPQQRGEALGAAGVFSTFGFGRKSMLGIFFEPKSEALAEAPRKKAWKGKSREERDGLRI